MPQDPKKSPKPPSWATDNQSNSQDSSSQSQMIFNNSDQPNPTPSSPSIPQPTQNVSPQTELNSNPNQPDNSNNSQASSSIPTKPPSALDMSNLNTVGLANDSEDNTNPIQEKFDQIDKSDSSDTDTNSKSELPNPNEPVTPVPPPDFSQNQDSPENQDQNSTQGMATNFKKSNKLKIIIPIIIIIILAIVFVVIKFVLPGNSANSNSPKSPSNSESAAKNEKESINLTIWGLWEDKAVMQQVLSDYEAQNSHIKINYILKDKTDYRETVQEAINSNIGPDIFLIHNTWLPMLKTYIQPDNSGLIDLNQYFPVVKNDFSNSNGTYAVPSFIDGLALFYNEDMFDNAGLTVPKTWDEVKSVSQKLTIKQDSEIKISGVALGDTNSIDNFSDILALMIMQDGGNPANPSDAKAKSVIKYYTMFNSGTNKVWDKSLGSSTYAFANEKVAMIIAPSWRYYEIKEINPTLNFKTAPVPQLPGKQTNWASYWANSVSKKSKNSSEAWKLLAFINDNENLQKIFNAQVELRGIGEVYAKKDLAQNLYGDGILGSFAKGSSTAQSWPMASRTHDDGINDKIIKYYEDAINKVILDDKNIDSALETAEKGISQVLTNYQ